MSSLASLDTAALQVKSSVGAPIASRLCGTPVAYLSPRFLNCVAKLLR